MVCFRHITVNTVSKVITGYSIHSSSVAIHYRFRLTAQRPINTGTKQMQQKSHADRDTNT